MNLSKILRPEVILQLVNDQLKNQLKFDIVDTDGINFKQLADAVNKLM